MTLAGRVGTGNIAGVATAITFGGPGAFLDVDSRFLVPAPHLSNPPWDKFIKKKLTVNIAAVLPFILKKV
jgi:hypothetical protein